MLDTSVPDIPQTTFPVFRSPELHPVSSLEVLCAYDELCDRLDSILIISDRDECNSNFSTVLKYATDYVRDHPDTYHTCSVLALKLLNLNLFIKNYELCLGKTLGLLDVFSEPNPDPEIESLKQFLLVVLLLVLKLTGDANLKELVSFKLDKAALCDTFLQIGLIRVMCQFVVNHIKSAGVSHSVYVSLKFDCDIIFQYLYHVVLLSDKEFEYLTESTLIPCLVSHLLSNDNFNNYDLKGDDFNDEDKLIAYEEFKLLLLINEQYMMKSFSSVTQQNKVFEGLLTKKKGSVIGICGFTNLLVYHLNREESHIIKILMLKFLYLILTSSFTVKLPYLNDLKILVDIIMRELNDMDYSSSETANETSLLALTYLKVLFPLLKFSLLSELSAGYKSAELLEMLRNIVVNCDNGSSSEDLSKSDSSSLATSIIKTALKCLSIPWVKASKPRQGNIPSRLMSNNNSSAESVTSASSLNSRVNALKLEGSPSCSSSDSISITKVASVRATTINDFNQHTTSHNQECEDIQEENIFEANNLNVFLTPKNSHGHSTGHTTHSAVKLLDIPKEYLLNKKLPPLPGNAGSTIHCSTGSKSFISIQAKAKQKKAPPPPPPSRRRRLPN